MSELSFAELNLPEEIQRAVDELGFETATGIQAEAIPPIRAGEDVIGRSQTGTGKTLAFGIPLLERVAAEPEKNRLQAIILCPTRELAQQACDELHKLSKYMQGVRAVEVYGGVPMDRQIVRLKKANIVVGTPGRIMDHMRRHTLKLDDVKLVVLDEADEMLSMGFKEDIETILTDTPAERQTVLFSATMPPAILALTRSFQRDPRLIEIDRQHITLENITQNFIDAPMGRKLDALNLLLRFHDPKRCMIFCNTKRMVDEVAEYLLKSGFTAAGLHGDMNQAARTRTLDGFKAGENSILVATDVAARGIDVNDIETVINYDIPQNAEYYIHRIGRTGRVGKAGQAITIASGRRQLFVLRDIARLTKSELKPLDIPTIEEIRHKSLQGNLEQVSRQLESGVSPAYSAMVDQLLAQGKEPHEIAAAALELCFGRQEREIVEIKTVKPAQLMGADAHWRKLVLGIGRDAGCQPNHIVGAVCEKSGLAGSEIGKIEIFGSKTQVSVPADKLELVVEAMHQSKILGRTVSAEAMEEAPFRDHAPRNGNFQRRGPQARRSAPKRRY